MARSVAETAASGSRKARGKGTRRAAAAGPGAVVQIDRDDLQKYLGVPPYTSREIPEIEEVGVATGLAWTSTGGDILPIDKHGSVLRIETVINHPYEFKVRRRGRRKGQEVLGWFPMSKGVANLYRYAEVSHAANSRYLEALSTVGDPAQAQQHLQKLANAISHNGRCYRGFNPAAKKDIDLFAAVLRGEHAIMGFRNRDILRQLFSQIKDLSTLRRLGARVSRLLKLLHIH